MTAKFGEHCNNVNVIAPAVFRKIIEGYAGNTIPFNFDWLAEPLPPARPEPVPVDLTGWSASMAFTVNGLTVLTLTSVLGGGIVLGGTPCNVAITLSPTQSQLLIGASFARLNLIDPLGGVYTKADLQYILR